MDVGEARKVAEVKAREKRSTKMSRKKQLFFKTGIELDPSVRLVFLFGIGMIILFDFCFNEEFFSTSTDILLGNTLTRLDASQLAQPVTKC